MPHYRDRVNLTRNKSALGVLDTARPHPHGAKPASALARQGGHPQRRRCWIDFEVACSKARSSSKVSEGIPLGVPLRPEPCRGVHSCKPLVVVGGANV